MKDATCQHRGQLLAPAGAQRGAAMQGKRDIAAELSGQVVQVPARHTGMPELVHGHQHSSGIGRSAGHTARDGDVLINEDRDVGGAAHMIGEKLGGLPGEIAVVGGYGALALPDHIDR
ncbi:Uncharacterised protein [Mycobacteroides abscessus subsp. massiliense]|nr:Uncharacterised protein [Mycobacteroides abscessus subsp. massiliense]